MFLTQMIKRYDVDIHDVNGGKKANEIAEEIGELFAITERTVYNYYNEWRDGEAERWEEIQQQSESKDMDESEKQTLLASIYGFGSFQNEKRGSWERQFLLDDEDLKIEFKRWLRKNIRRLTVDRAQRFLNDELLPKVGEVWRETC